MGNGPNVITLLDRFTLTSAGGGAFMNSPWVNVPTWCRTAEVLFECFAFNGGGSVDMKLESSMDRVEVEGLATKSFTGPLVAQAKLTAGLGRYARVRLTGQGGVAVDAVLSAHLILRTAE